MKFAAALLAVASARHHHHHHGVEFVNEEAALEAMSDSQLVENLQSTLHSALRAEARDDVAAAVAARHHHHHDTELLETLEAYEAMNED